jgi:hypothetical protein
MSMTIINGGGGLAKGVAFVLVAGRHYGIGHVGFLRPGEEAHFRVDIPGTTEGVQAVVFGRDQNENSYGWSHEGSRHQFRRTRRKPFRTDLEIFGHFYPETDFGALTEGATLRATQGFPA